MHPRYWEYAKCKYTKMELKYHSFWEKYEIWKKSIFEHFFRTRKSKNSVFRGSEVEVEILEKIEKNRESVRGGRVSCGNHPKPIFWSLGGPCEQNESYTSLVRSFSKKLCFCEVWPFLADFPKSTFSRKQNLLFLHVLHYFYIIWQIREGKVK